MENENFLWIPRAIDDNDWDGSLQTLREVIPAQLSSLKSSKVDAIKLQNKDECAIADGSDLQTLFENAEDSEILIKVLHSHNNEVLCEYVFH